jgi:hypothetical protein
MAASGKNSTRAGRLPSRSASCRESCLSRAVVPLLGPRRFQGEFGQFGRSSPSAKGYGEGAVSREGLLSVAVEPDHSVWRGEGGRHRTGSAKHGRTCAQSFACHDALGPQMLGLQTRRLTRLPSGTRSASTSTRPRSPALAGIRKQEPDRAVGPTVDPGVPDGEVKGGIGVKRSWTHSMTVAAERSPWPLGPAPRLGTRRGRCAAHEQHDEHRRPDPLASRHRR